jgi:hypothetical protein
MKHRNAIAAIATATALAATCAVVVPAASASTCPPNTHTLTFTSIRLEDRGHDHIPHVSSRIRRSHGPFDPEILNLEILTVLNGP